MERIKNIKATRKIEKSELLSWIYCGLICITIFILFNFVFMITSVASGSMEPTLMTGGNTVMNRLAYVFDEVERGDIVSFYSDEYGLNFTKRVIGLPNDKIEFIDGYVFINGKMLEEDYIPEDIETNCGETFVVPEGCYFMLGDNRENSTDSRYWDNPYIPKNKIRARMISYTDIVKNIKELFGSSSNIEDGNNIQKDDFEFVFGEFGYSDINTMLPIGGYGFYNVIGHKGNVCYPLIRINQLYTGESAVNILKNNTNYSNPPEGYSWHVVQYDISYEQCERKSDGLYTNICLIGLDGNNLEYNGIKCSTMTHDTNSMIRDEGSMVYNYYCYYAVPNGCEEYALRVGDHFDDDNLDFKCYNAYYIITSLGE